MRFKGTLVLLIVCLALGSYLYFYEIKGGEQREKAKEAENQVWKLEGKDIQQIELDLPSQHITAVRKSEKEWATHRSPDPGCRFGRAESPGELGIQYPA